MTILRSSSLSPPPPPLPISKRKLRLRELSEVQSYTAGMRQSQHLDQDCAQYNPFAKFDMEQEVANARRTTDYKGNFPVGPSETPRGTHCPFQSQQISGLTTDSPVSKIPQGAPQPPSPRPRMPLRSSGTSSRRNMQARTDPVYLGWRPKSLNQHKKQHIPSK